MGCSSGKSQNAVLLGNTSSSLYVLKMQVFEQKESRAALESLDAQQLEFLANAYTGPSGHVYAIGSTKEAITESFHDKKRMHIQTNACANPCANIGLTCRKGLKPGCPNQDSWMMLRIDSETAAPFCLYGVFDGHGRQGHEVSDFVKTFLPKMLLKDEEFGNCLGKEGQERAMKRVLESVFERLHSFIAIKSRAKGFEAATSGTTCTVAIHDIGLNVVHLANVANSTGVVGVEQDKTWKVDVRTRDHKPNEGEEKTRIIQSGGRVVFDGYANHRVYAKHGNLPGLNMSRCLGGLLGHNCGCTAMPEVYTCKLTSTHRVLLLCSDGIWEFIPPGEALVLVKQYLEDAPSPQEAADKLAWEAWSRWIKTEQGQVVDDITVILVVFDDLG